MVGMMQILIWLGCTVVVLLGIITLQIGMASAKEKKGELIALGYAAVVIGIAAAVVCFGLGETMAASISSNAPF